MEDKPFQSCLKRHHWTTGFFERKFHAHRGSEIKDSEVREFLEEGAKDDAWSRKNPELQVDVEPKIGGVKTPPKWMVYFMENPIKMDDLGVYHLPLFLETPR